MIKKLTILCCVVLLAACSNNDTPPDVSKYPPSPFKGVKVGKPYKIKGKWYSPHHNPNYDKKGVASWYGPNFHGKKTANGERYNQNGYTAAHKTLPLPSIVRVTNLENGKAMNLRVNDRGPFHDNRIIDLSKAAAQKLGVIKHGVAKVRVEYLDAETRQYVASKGRRGADVKFSTNFADYRGAEPVARKVVIKQDIKSIPIEAVGKHEPAPLKQVTISALPDITPKQIKTYNAPWVIQVASYADTINAQNLMSKLTSIGKPLLQEVAIKGQPFYRVLLKPDSAKSSRFGMLSMLQRRFGIDDAKVIAQ